MARQPPPPSDLDGFLPLLSTTDTKRKLQIGTDLVTYLGDPTNSIDCLDIGHFIDGLIPWMQSSNFKVCQNGLDAMYHFVDRMGPDFRPYIQTVLTPIVDRLGDSKDMVREKAQLLLLKMLEKDVISVQLMFEKLTPAFSHKNGRIREEILNTFVATINEHGAQSLSISKLIPSIVKLLSDPQPPVRDAAFNTLVDVYRHVGERLRHDLNKKYQLPPSKLPALMSRFDEIREEGNFLPSALTADVLRDEDEVDKAIVKTTMKKPTCAPPSSAKRNVAPSSASKMMSAAPGPAGAVDEEQFMRHFEDVPKVQLFSQRELEENLNQVRETISDQTKDWMKRVESLKRVRSLLIAGAGDYEETMLNHLRLLELAFQSSINDLRSSVVREACITVAYMSTKLKHKLDHFVEVVFPNLIQLIQNSAKVVASSGVVCIRFILEHTHAPRLIPIIATNLSSKSRDIRRACCEFLDQLVHAWPRCTLEKRISLLQDALKKGIADADAEARLSSRKAFWGFKEKFPEQADALLNTLDASYKRAIYGEISLSNSSSNSSLHHQGLPTSRYAHTMQARSRPSSSSSAQGSTENLYQQPQPQQPQLFRQQSLRGHRSGIPVPKPQSAGAKAIDTDSLSRRNVVPPSPSTMMRSNSAIDPAAAQRAKVRAQYAALARQKVGSGASLHYDDARASKSPVITSPERVSRTRTRVAGVSQSQPTSRSGSPSSRLSYVTYGMRGEVDVGDGSALTGAVGRPRRLSSGIPRSTHGSRDTSRETSPNRFGSLGGHLYDRSFGSKLRGRHMTPPDRLPPTSRPVMAQKILQQSREAESALADALSIDPTEGSRSSPRKSYRSFDDHSDDSETSSVCSERSYDHYRRASDSYSWSGSQQRLYRDVWEPTHKDVEDMIANCANTHWNDRKDGLTALQYYFQAGNMLTATQLRRVTEIFSKMFTDSHTKVFSLFLDTLNELVVSHHVELNDWLYVLLTRLLIKSGADLLVSQQTKIQKSLEVVRESFPLELQLSALMRFLTDPAQTPNVKVKVATLKYLTLLAKIMDPSGFASVSTSPSPGGSTDQTANALAKIIGWTQTELSMSGGKGGDIRREAQQALIALFNLNTPLVTMRLATLPKEYQDAARNLVQSDLRRSSDNTGHAHSNGVSSNLSSPASSNVSSPPQIQSPRTPTPTGARASPLRTLSNHHQGGHHTSNIPHHHHHSLDDENLNPEEVYKSLRRTTAEIQNYSFEPLSAGKLLDRDRDRDTTSQDSGISQMSVGPGDKLEALEERIEDLTISCTNSGRSSSLPSPNHRFRDCNGLLNKTGNSLDGENGYITKSEEDHLKDVETIRDIVEVLKVDETPIDKKIGALTHLELLVQEGSTLAIVDNFKVLLRVIINQIDKPEGATRKFALQILTEMVKKPALTQYFQTYMELLVLKVLKSHSDASKEVLRAAEACAAALAMQVPPEVLIRVILPLIVTGDYPVNQSSIKMLTKIVEHHGSSSVEHHLSELMPGIIKAYDNEESSVRKAAVFCMVALYVAVGEDALAPHLASLPGPKKKLLDLYIKRAQKGGAETSLPTSPKNVHL